jgi:hypothetical protein
MNSPSDIPRPQSADNAKTAAATASQTRLEAASQVIDDLAKARSQTFPTPPDSSAPAVTTLSHVLREVLPQVLSKPREEVDITKEHECFEFVRNLKPQVSESTLNNFIELVCGNHRFPTILLVDSDVHIDAASYNDMVESSPTLLWIEKALGEIGLGLSDVSILVDIKNRALSIDAISVVTPSVLDQTLEALAPEILVVLESSGGAGNFPSPLACLSGSEFRVGHVENVSLGSSTIHTIKAIGPSASDSISQLSKDLLRKLYRPCGRWKYPIEALMALDKSFSEGCGVLKKPLDTFGGVTLRVEDVDFGRSPMAAH